MSNKSQNDFIDCYLDSSFEVSDRFTSQQATYWSFYYLFSWFHI